MASRVPIRKVASKGLLTKEIEARRQGAFSAGKVVRDTQAKPINLWIDKSGPGHRRPESVAGDVATRFSDAVKKQINDTWGKRLPAGITDIFVKAAEHSSELDPKNHFSIILYTINESKVTEHLRVDKVDQGANDKDENKPDGDVQEAIKAKEGAITEETGEEASETKK